MKRKLIKKIMPILLSTILITGCGQGLKDKEGSKSQSDILKYDIYMQTVQTNEYIYDEYTEHIELRGLNIDNTVINVPSEIDGKKVTVLSGICNNNLENEEENEDVVKVVIPDTVTKIEGDAFSGLKNVSEIDIPKSVKEIERNSLFDTIWFDNLTEKYVIVGDGVLIKYNGIETELVIPEGVKYISNFFGGLKNENRETYVDEDGFECLRSKYPIKKVTLPDGVEVIGKNAFNSLTMGTLEKINIPSTVKRIDSNAFENTKWYENLTDENMIVGDGILMGCNDEYINKDRELIIPEGVKYIYSLGKIDKEKYTCVVLPDSCEGWCDEMFVSFATMDTLDKIVFQDNLKILSSIVNCQPVQMPINTIVMPNSLIAIDKDAVCAYEKEELELPLNLLSIGPRAFSNSYIIKITLNDSLLYIGEKAFYQCKIEELTIPASVRIIGRGAFQGNRNLYKLIIEDGVEEIQAEAFAGCVCIEGVWIPKSVSLIDENAFESSVVIYGEKGSEAENFAMKNGNKFVEGENASCVVYGGIEKDKQVAGIIKNVFVAAITNEEEYNDALKGTELTVTVSGDKIEVNAPGSGTLAKYMEDSLGKEYGITEPSSEVGKKTGKYCVSWKVNDGNFSEIKCGTGASADDLGKSEFDVNAN